MKKFLDDLDDAFTTWDALEKNKIGKIVEHKIVNPRLIEPVVGKDIKENVDKIRQKRLHEMRLEEIVDDEDDLHAKKMLDNRKKMHSIRELEDHHASRFHKPYWIKLFFYEILINILALIIGFGIIIDVALMITGIVVYCICYAICYMKVSNESRKITSFNVDTRYGCMDVDRIEPIIHDQVKIIQMFKQRDDEDHSIIDEIMHVIDEFEASSAKKSGKIIFTQSFISKCLVSLVDASDTSKARLMTYGTSILAHQDASPEVIINLQKNFLAALQVCMNEHLSETRKHEQEMLESVAKNSF